MIEPSEISSPGSQALRGGGYHREAPPIVSTITVVLNAAASIEETLQSLFNDSNRTSFEIIVIDGGSTDGTVDFLRKHDANIDYWVSERDRGIYDAMTKGIRAAHG